mmetsp:Transcript_10378/g.22873  ORF Transcript_10378/g.22873 Transcript_10378/m.22873 type:complete len:117 (-) Transcript_10378:117-467(-)
MHEFTGKVCDILSCEAALRLSSGLHSSCAQLARHGPRVEALLGTFLMRMMRRHEREESWQTNKVDFGQQSTLVGLAAQNLFVLAVIDSVGAGRLHDWMYTAQFTTLDDKSLSGARQ